MVCIQKQIERKEEKLEKLSDKRDEAVNVFGKLELKNDEDLGA